MTYIRFIKLVLLNAVSAAIHTDTHFGATTKMLLEATYPPDMWDTKNWTKQQKIGPSNIFLIFVSLLRLALKVVARTTTVQEIESQCKKGCECSY